MNRGERLNQAMKDKGYNAMSLSKESGVPYTTIRSMIERDLKNASIDNVIKVCKVLGITTNYLIEENSYLTEDKEVPTVAESEVNYHTSNSKTVSLPIYGDVAAGMLTKLEGVTLNEVNHICFPKSLLGKYESSNNLFALSVNGESMNKLLPNHSIIVNKPTDIMSLKNGDIVVYSHDGDYSLKRFERDDEDRVFVFRPESTNRKFRETVIPFDTQSDLKVHGKVVAYAVTIN
ncbi:helix-turn-helix domain-containing protein [Virgibacillus halodenitrificans]|nr:helix-turn-helix domain-containing protein [Virgibacillus halodenitrificans]